ncbi:MAG: hypothetical protein R6U50_04740 [Desulfobacterales bacterium]
MDTIPKNVNGLKLISGPRTKKSIIQDMVPVVCYGRVIFEKLKKRGETNISGHALFRVVVEYTGEVNSVHVEETTIGSEKFLRNLSDLIMDTDFIGWRRTNTDTVFLYPMTFNPAG